MPSTPITIAHHREEIQIRKGAHCILEGVAENGHFQLRFTRRSGAQAELALKGQATTDQFELKGSGTVHLGRITLSGATVKVTPSCVEIGKSVKWFDQHVTIRFVTNKLHASWSGNAEFCELLCGAVTESEKLRISVILESPDPETTPVRCTLRTRLDGLKLYLSLDEQLDEISDNSFAALRIALLAALSAEIKQELCRLEALYTSCNHDVLHSAALGDPVFSMPVDANLSHGFGIRKFSDERPGLPTDAVRSGYLPVSPENKPLAMNRGSGGGYLEAERKSLGVRTSGYLPVSGEQRTTERFSAIFERSRPNRLLHRTSLGDNTPERTANMGDPLPPGCMPRRQTLPGRRLPHGYLSDVAECHRHASTQEDSRACLSSNVQMLSPARGAYLPPADSGIPVRPWARPLHVIRGGPSPYNRTARSATMPCNIDSPAAGSCTEVFESPDDDASQIAGRILRCKDILRSIERAMEPCQ